MLEYRIKMSIQAARALGYCLGSAEVKGRSQTRDHARLTRALESGCYDKQPDGTLKPKENGSGVLVIDEDRFKVLEKMTDKQVEKQVPGELCVGFDDLLEAVDEAKVQKNEIKEEKEKKSA